MLASEVIPEQILSLSEIVSDYTHQLLQSFVNVEEVNLSVGDYLNFKIQERMPYRKINPIITYATEKDIDEIIFIYNDIYEGSYPYKEMEDKEEIKKMINSPDVEWLMFRTKDGEIVGCFTFTFDFENKMGYTRGFNIKKKFVGKIDVLKAFMGSFLAMVIKYEGIIYRWYGESRTAHAKSQYFMRPCGFRPVGFYPCKDMFYDKVESDILIVSYDEKSLKELRSKKIPKIIPEAEDGFIYSDNRYNLGFYQTVEPYIELNYAKITRIKKNLRRKVVKDKFGYTDIIYALKNSDSYFKFLYTPQVENFEKTKYKVDNLEELFVFVQEFKKCVREFNVRYCEVFVSGYKTDHQKIFRDTGLTPRGYIPSWKYDIKSNSFEDYVLFNWHEGEIDGNIQLLSEGKELLECLNYCV